MALYKGGAFVEDTWKTVASDEPVTAATAPGTVLSLSAWKAVRDELGRSNAPVAVRLEAGEMVEEIAADVHRFAMVALAFPKFNDGRAFSKAHELRDEYGFKGEVRAVGDVLWDQLQLMARCGFDAYEITNEPTLAALRSGKKPFMTEFYQPGFGPETQEGAKRAWARRTI